MLIQTLYAPESGVYTQQSFFPLNSLVDLKLFRVVWEELTEIYSVLRTSFHWENLQQPVQVVHRSAKLSWEEHDLTPCEPDARRSAIQHYLAADRRRGFDLSQAPLMRLALLRLEPGESLCVWTFHHAILDGWSVQTLMKKMVALYEARARGAIAPPEKVRPYSEYIEWLQKQDAAEATAYWRRFLRGITEPTRFRVDRNVARAAADEFAEKHASVPALTTSRIKELAGRHRLTVNTFVQGAWGLLLSRYSGARAVLFGAVVSGRPADLPGVESMVGMFINALPLRVTVAADAGIIDWLKGIQAQQLESRKYEYSHLLQIQEASEIPPGMPIFESVLVFENVPRASSWNTRQDYYQRSGLLERTNMPLTLMITPDTELVLNLFYSCRRFDALTIERMLGHLVTLLDEIARDSQRAVGEVEMLIPAERRQLLEEWNDTRHEMPAGTVVDLFEAQSTRTPEAVAFMAGDDRITFIELNRRANRLARHLQALGVGSETPVGICIERSIDFVVAQLAIFKAGGAYVPLDPAYPRDRLEYMLADAGVRVLLTVTSPSAVILRLKGLATFHLDVGDELLECHCDANLGSNPSPHQLACVIYTSGSTGRPKGVAIEHGQVLNRIHWMSEAYPFQPGEVAAQKTAANFVDSIWEFLGPLLQGIPSIIIRAEVVRDASALIEELARHRVTRLLLVPSLLRALLDLYPDLQDRLPDLRFWVSSGESLPPELAKRFRAQMPRSVLYNLYGSSEAWDSIWLDPTLETVSDDCAPIGRPIFNMQARILDGRMQPVPVGVSGELHIGGAGVARCYLNQAELTARKFIPDPFRPEPGARLYRTGDVARFLPNGTIEYLGRIDDQVKIRGHRVEPGEIEAVLSEHPDVKQAVVIADQIASGKRLIAYVVPRGTPEPDAGELRRFMKLKLPDPMLPSVFIRLGALPLTPNGKLNRSALPRPDGDDMDAGRTIVAPRTETEQALRRIWSEVLGVRPEQVGIHDHFFADLGGHSLLATQLVSRIRNTLRTELPLRRLFETPTIDAVAREIDAATTSRTAAVPGIQRLDRERFRVTRPD